MLSLDVRWAGIRPHEQLEPPSEQLARFADTEQPDAAGAQKQRERKAIERADERDDVGHIVVDELEPRSFAGALHEQTDRRTGEGLGGAQHAGFRH